MWECNECHFQFPKRDVRFDVVEDNAPTVYYVCPKCRSRDLYYDGGPILVIDHEALAKAMRCLRQQPDVGIDHGKTWPLIQNEINRLRKEEGFKPRDIALWFLALGIRMIPQDVYRPGFYGDNQTGSAYKPEMPKLCQWKPGKTKSHDKQEANTE